MNILYLPTWRKCYLSKGENIFHAKWQQLFLSLIRGEYLFHADEHNNFISLNGEKMFTSQLLTIPLKGEEIIYFRAKYSKVQMEP
jgi:hypothetical protein